MRPNKRGTLPAGDASSAYRYIDADRSLHCILLQKKNPKIPQNEIDFCFYVSFKKSLTDTN